MADFAIGDRVSILGKSGYGKIAFVGHTHFSNGLCFGVNLDEPKGRNNGSVDGMRYFKCCRNHGIFVRECQLRTTSQNKSVVVKSEDRPKNVVRYPNYLKAKNPLIFHRATRKYKNSALTPRKILSDSHLTPERNFHYNKETYIKPGTTSIKKYHLKNTEFPNNIVKLIALEKHTSAFNLNTDNFQDSDSENNDKVEAGQVKLKQMIKKLEIELKYSRKVIEKNSTDKLHLEGQLNHYQKHSYALQKKINKVNKDLAESDRKIKILEQKMEQLHEITEMSVIEKEISEHKIELMEADFQELATAYEILQTELSIKDEEMQIQCEDKVSTINYRKYLESQNKALCDALLQLRNMYISKRHNFLEAEERIKSNVLALQDSTINQGNLENVIFVLNQDVADMLETIDGLTEVDELIFEVTDKSLNLENEMAIQTETLDIAKEYIEVTNEIEEILQECYMEREKEIEVMEHKLYSIEKSYMNANHLITDYKKEIKNYSNLVFDLRRKNDALEFKLDLVSRERKLSVMETENLKLQLNRKNKLSLLHLVKDENLEIENQILQQQIKYLELYLPENFLGRNEHLAIQSKLLLSKIIRKISLLQKYIKLRDFKDPFPSTQSHLQMVKFNTHFLLHIFVLEELLKTYDVSLDHTNIQNFLSSGAYSEILIIKLREIDHFLDLLCRKELDTPQSIKSLHKTLNMFHGMLKLNFCPETKKRRLRIEYLLKKILICVECIKEHLVVFKNTIKSLENKNMMEIEIFCSTLKRDVSYLIKGITDCKSNQMLCCNTDSVCHLKKALLEMVKLMELVLKDCEKIYVGDLNFETVHTFLVEDLKKLWKISMGIQLMKDLVQEGENLKVYDPDALSSTFISWIKDKKTEKENMMNEFQKKLFFLERKLLNINQKQINENKLLKQRMEKSSQTDEKVNHLIENEVSTVVSLKLYDMDCSLNFLNFKIQQLEKEKMQNRLSYLRPLKLPSKRKHYHPDVHYIIIFQKTLNKISEDLMKVILPEVVDISSRTDIFKLSGLIQRDMIKKDIQERIQILSSEIIDFKNKKSFK